MNMRGIRYLMQSYSEMNQQMRCNHFYDEYPDEKSSLDMNSRAGPGLFMVCSVSHVLVKLVDQESLDG